MLLNVRTLIHLLLLASVKCDPSNTVFPPSPLESRFQDFDHIRNRQSSQGDLWIEQRLNNFDALDKRMWMQRYRSIDKFHTFGGPAILYLSGETELPSDYGVSDFVQRLAKKVGGMVYHLEHRYYGKSRPTRDSNVKSLRFLSSEQALADIANFIGKMTFESNDRISKWILCGASYAGSLALWSKLKYPHLVFGVFAASPPLTATPFFTDYVTSVNSSLYQYGGDVCYKAVSKATYQVSELIKTEAGKRRLHFLFNLCPNTDLTGYDQWIFHGVINNNIDNIVQYSRYNVLQKEPVKVYVTLDEMCDIMSTKALGDEIERFAFLVNHRRNTSNCLDVNFNSFVRYLSRPRKDLRISTRNWFFQSCTEFGWFQTASSAPPFLQVPEDFPGALCSTMFRHILANRDILTGTQHTNVKYGGTNAVSLLTRAVIFNGGVDPWHMLSYWKDKREVPTDCTSYNTNLYNSKSSMWARQARGLSSIFVKSSSHAEVMREESGNDSFELICARQTILNLVKTWF